MTRPWRGGRAETPQELYDEIFHDEDLVVLIDVEDRFDFGVLYTHPDGVELWSPNRKARHYRFDQVRFLAHDGVPLRRLRGYSEPDDELLGRLERAARARDAVVVPTKRTHPRKHRRHRSGSPLAGYWKQDQLRAARFGDPYEVELVAPRLYQHPDWRETCVVFGDTIERRHGGNAGLLWDLGSILEVA